MQHLPEPRYRHHNSPQGNTACRVSQTYLVTSFVLYPLIFPENVPRNSNLGNLAVENAADSLAKFLLHPQDHSSLWQRLLQKEHPHHPVLSQRWELPARGRDKMLISATALHLHLSLSPPQPDQSRCPTNTICFDLIHFSLQAL